MYKRVIRKIIRILELTIKEKKQLLVLKDDGAGRSVDELVADFDKIQVEEGSIVFIHSGFKSIGAVKGGPDTVVSALIKSFVKNRNVTVAMPSFTLSGSMKDSLTKKNKFDVRTTPTVYKDIPAAFQQRLELERSIHPTHSVMAIGAKAKWLVESHHTCGSTFGKGSPFGKLLEDKSYILGLGTRLGTVTFYHTLEDIEENFPFRVYTKDSPFDSVCIDYRGKRVKVTVSAHDDSISPVRIDRRNGGWLRDIYTALLEDNANLQWFNVGKAKTWLCDSSKLYSVQKSLTFAGLSIYSTEKNVADYITKTLFNTKKQNNG